MDIIWSGFASKALEEIFCYYKEVAGEKIAEKLKTGIFTTTRQLSKLPYSGQIEETLAQLNEAHRYLIFGSYKIVYKKVREGILITDVFDTRQDPKKINKPRRKPED